MVDVQGLARAVQGALTRLGFCHENTDGTTWEVGFSDLAYAANGSCIDTVICDGKILMTERTVEGEEEIMERARRAAFDLLRRASK